MKHIKLINEYLSDDNSDFEFEAKFELFGAECEIAFSFAKVEYTDPKEIIKLINKYNQTYKKNNEWGGGPVNSEFIKYFEDRTGKRINKSEWKPKIVLIINTEFGRLKLGYSLNDKKADSIDWSNFIDVESEHGQIVQRSMTTYVDDKIYKKDLTLEETINILKLKVKNYIDWTWKS